MPDQVIRSRNVSPGIDEFERVNLPSDVEDISTLRDYNGGIREITYGPGRAYYSGRIFPVANEIQYTRIIVPKGTFTQMRFFLIDGGISGATVRIGLFGTLAGEPRSIEHQGSYVLSGGDNNRIVNVTLDIPIVIDDGRLLKWASFSCSSAIPRFLGTSNQLHGKVHPVRFENTADGTFPSTATPVKRFGGIIWVALFP